MLNPSVPIPVPSPFPPSLLENTATTARSLVGWNRKRRRGRALQRCLTGLGQHPDKYWRYAFVTLTSSPAAPMDIQRSWRKLHERMRRRGWAGRYIRITERGPNTGMVHIHMVIESIWLDQKWLSKQWKDIHNSPVVDVRRCKTGKQGWAMTAAIELGNYLAKEPINRMSCSAHWSFPAIARHWYAWRTAARAAGLGFQEMLGMWKQCARWVVPPERARPAIDMLLHSPNALAILSRLSRPKQDACLATTLGSMRTSLPRARRHPQLSFPSARM